ALIYEAHIAQRFYRIWCAWCTPETQLKRLMRRDNLAEKQAHAHIRSQMSADEKKSLADLSFNTDCSYSTLMQSLEQAIQNLKNER
ncbi:MAG: dephospho-CoA kinase, partial [Zetaproteobacteria bacterium]|nr:dephospho-CoA kinase [Zetaproteobacteria bacterium]